jgi:methylthioribose-1-phosphate isomerase
VDLATASGADIPIEERAAAEIWAAAGGASPGASASNPAFDVTPAELIDAMVTERGVVAPVTEAGIRDMMSG